MDTEGGPFWNLIMECIFAAFFLLLILILESLESIPIIPLRDVE